MSEVAFDEAFESGEGRMGLSYEDVPEPEDEIVDEPIDQDTYSLVYLGHLTSSVTIRNHTINIRTLKIGEELEAALLADKYKDTVEAGRALATALVAASVTTVDGKPLVASLGPVDNIMEQRFLYILNNWYWQPTIRTVYAEYNSMALQAQQVEEDVKKG